MSSLKLMITVDFDEVFTYLDSLQYKSHHYYRHSD